MTSQATLRFIGHMGRNGGNLWALKAAERYFPEGHLILRAYQTRCNTDLAPLPEQGKLNRFIENSSENRTRVNPLRADPFSLLKERTYSSRRERLQVMIIKRR